MVDSHNRTVLTYYGLMLSGAVARSAAATAVHPLNVIKTMLQTKEGNLSSYRYSLTLFTPSFVKVKYQSLNGRYYPAVLEVNSLCLYLTEQ